MNWAAAHTREKIYRARLLLAQLLVVSVIVAPYWYWDGGLLELEATNFIQQYLDSRGLLQKIFDPHANDLGTYQARELSYFVDYLDARVFRLLIAGGHVVFVPASALLSSLLTVIIFFRSARRYTALGALTATLLLLLYLTNYVHIVTMGMFYRSTKPVLAPLLMGTTFYIMSLIGVNAQTAASAPVAKRAPLIVFALLSGMSLLDRQGFFYALLGSAVLICHAVLARGRRDVPLAAVAAVAFAGLYDLVLAPLIVESVNAYVPSFDYQRLPLTILWRDPGHFVRGGELLAQAAALLMGGVPIWMGVALFSLVLLLALRRRNQPPGALAHGASWAHSSRTNAKIILVIAMVTVALVFMSAAMIARHPPVYDEYDHRIWYYPLPFQALLIAVLVPLLSDIASRWNSRMALVNLLLVAGLVSNVLHWSDYARRQRQSPWFSTVYTQTYLLKLSLQAGRPYLVHESYLDFYRFCLKVSPPLRARAERAPS